MKIFLLAPFFLVSVYCEDMLCSRCKCTSNAQTLTIDCRNKNLDHGVDAWPPHNHTLITVTFSGNDITTLEPFPATNASLELVLGKCNVKYLSSGLFARAKNVKFLDLSHNLLTSEELAADRFKGPYNNSIFEPIALESLNLAFNQIHSLAKNMFEHMPNLTDLNLEGNDFKVLDIQTQLALTSAKNLQILNLADNELTEVVKNAIIGHPNLRNLNLAKNLLDFVPDSLGHVGKSLEVLTLDDNPILDLTADSFVGLENIKELSLNNLTKLEHINANTFLPMRKLKKLSISNNLLLETIDREAFAVGQTLEEFYLNNNVLSRIDYKLLVWSGLRVFEFKENPLDCSCDLYNITTALSKDITKIENGPYCTDPRGRRPVQVFYLKSDICGVKSKGQRQMEFIQYHFSLVRTSLIILSVILMVVALVVVVLGYVRYRKYRRNISYPYASPVMYNPLSTSSRI